MIITVMLVVGGASGGVAADMDRAAGTWKTSSVNLEIYSVQVLAVAVLLKASLVVANSLRSGRRVSKGTNLRIKVKLTLEEIANGTEKKIKVKRKVQAAGVTYKTCSTCNGQGQVMRVTNTILGRMQSASTCPTCGGSGQILDKKPANADSQGMILGRRNGFYQNSCWCS